MGKNGPVVFVGLALLLLASGGFLVWQKSQANTPAETESTGGTGIRKIDLSTQPEWVQKLVVSARKGTSANGLENVTFTVNGMPKGLVESFTYVLSYQTTNKGTQGALSTKPVEINGAETASKTVDLGTCSTKSCVRHEGVTAVELELDFSDSNGGSPAWSGLLELK